MTTNEASGAPWLLLIHQLPAKPAYARVKVWRRLQALGAVTVKGAVYALPANAETREDFAWLAKEIVESGGEAIVCEAALVDGLSDGELQALFESARDEDYQTIAAEARDLAARLADDLPDNALAEIAGQVARLRKQLEARLQREDTAVTTERTDGGPAATGEPGRLKGRVWVTRQGVQIDRIASAWLIRRFIVQGARFKFVPGTGYAATAGELRFDMFEGEFTHRGDRCTFEVLLAEAGLDDPALGAIGEIIHDIDLKDGKYGREEAAGIRTLIAGIASSHNDDNQRLERGGAVFDDLHRSFAGKRDDK